MFEKMIIQLREGCIPPADYLASLLKVALVKKQGVLKQPPACWSSDPKINPDAKHLLWAASLLGREEEVHIAAGIMMNEMITRPGSLEPGQELQVVNEKLMEIAALAPSKKFATLLKKKADQAWNLISISKTE